MTLTGVDRGAVYGEVHVHMKRIGSAMLAVAVGVATAALATGQPALAATSANLTLASWSYLDSHSPQAKFVNPAVPPPVGTFVDSADTTHTYRSYFTYDLTQLAGAVVHNSYLYTNEDTVTDCATAATIEVWRTDPVSDETTWNKPPAELEKLVSSNRGGPGSYYCPGYLGIDMVSVLNAALSRQEKSITLEYRIAAAQEADAHAGRTIEQPTLSSTSNHPPTVSDLQLSGPDRPCGTLHKPSPAAALTSFKATANDPDQGDHPRITFAIWPVDQPDQRREFSGSYGTDLSQYADGELLGWQARASDYYDAGPWSPVCYIIMDKTAPANAPLVSSKIYPEGDTPGGGTGIKGKFRLDAGGDRDVVAFRWRDPIGNNGEVQARRPGGRAILEYTPPWSRTADLYVTSIDAAGNHGPEKDYHFWVADTAPGAEVTMNGVGLPSTVSLTAQTPDTTGFGYQIKGGPETRVPAVDGKATGQVTFTATGQTNLIVSSYAKNKLIGQNTLYVSVTDAPRVTSAEFSPDADQLAGTKGSFTFTPRNSDVVAYEYLLDDGWQTVPAATDDTAVVQWTATPGWQEMVVRSVKADGSKSMDTYYQFDVLDPVPSVYAPTLDYSTRTDGIGLPVQFYLGSQLPNATGFAYRFDGGAEITVDGPGGSAEIEVTPVHTGDNTLTVQALLSDGSRSPQQSFTWQPFEAPVITTDPPNGGAVAQPMTLTFHSVLPNTKEFRYSLDWGDYQTVAAEPDGTATVSFTPQWVDWFSARVTGMAEDGTESPEREMTIEVRDTRVSVWSQYNDWSPKGGIGVPGQFSFSTAWTPEVVEYVYRLNDGPESTVPIADSWNTLVTLVPDHNGLNSLTVQGRTSSGLLSPVTEYQFLVGTAPYVFSEVYPAGTPGGGVGVAGRFDFSGGMPGITSFEYTIGGVTGTVDADAQGRASITWTPTEATGLYLVVKGHTADGGTSDEVRYYISVKSG